MPAVSVIITTYNNPAWLEKVLWGYQEQTFTDFEVVIADDGSKDETSRVIDKFKSEGKLDIKHIWHADKGYRKCTIMNKGILSSDSEYLIFTDGDCIPRNDFVETHMAKSKRGYFLSGGALRLPMELSINISHEHIIKQNPFRLRWLKRNCLQKSWKNSKLVRNRFFTETMDMITPTKASWNGGNSSGWKEDILRINGFNEEMLYGGQDREFGERLINSGIKSRQLRYSAICIHLEHDRPYKTRESIEKNISIRKSVKKTGRVKTDSGINSKLKS